MKKKLIIYIILIAPSTVLFSCSSVPVEMKKNWGEMALEESAVPIHPGVPGKTPFWNGYARRFIYAPAFNYRKIDNATKYRYNILSLGDSSTYSFESDIPYAALSPVWKKIPVSLFILKVIGISDHGDSLGVAGGGQYYRASPFDPDDGAYHEPVMPYDSSAMVALDKLMHKDYVNYWLTHKAPDPDYGVYRYPAKIMSALIIGAVTHARLKPGSKDAERSTKLACIVADYLINISYPESSFWPNFPPTYHGPRIGKKPRSHMQLVNNLTIMGADAGNAYLDLYDLTGNAKYLETARKIARTYIKTQLDNGSWYLYVNHETGEPIAKNIAIPTGPVNFLDRLREDYDIKGLEQSTTKAVNWLMTNPAKSFNWQGQFEDVGTFPPYKRQSREQACDLAIYLFKHNDDLKLAEELVRFAEDQFVIWEHPEDMSIKNRDNPGWHAKNWITPSVQEQYGFWMPVNRSAGIMLQTYWEAYETTKKDIYLAKAKSIANTITVVQKANDGNYPTMFIKTPWNLWLNSAVYPAKAMMMFENNLAKLE